MRLFVDVFASPVAEIVLAVDERGALKQLEFVGRKSREEHLTRISRRGEVHLDPAPCVPVREQVEEYFDGHRKVFDVELAADGTDFQKAVWRALCAIPYGETMSYGELAKHLGRPNASRAVGRANGTNPIALIVPCHRVIGADGSLTGYASGEPMKRALLDFERGQLSFTR